MFLLKNITIVAPYNDLNGQMADIWIDKEGKIGKIGTNIKAPEGTTMIQEEGLCVSIGWVDTGVHTGEMGQEHLDDFRSIALAAAAGGFTTVLTAPNTQPAVHSKSEVLYIINQTRHEAVDFLPIGAISHDCKGVDLAEMLDMHYSGAVAFSDGKRPIQSTGLLLRALQYAKTVGATIINHPHDQTIAPAGQMHEGLTSTSLGLPAIPTMSEELMIQRDLQLVEYCQSPLHLSNISSSRGVELVRQAKKKGLPITASVAVLNLAYDDTSLRTFNSNFKVLPPLRDKTDMEALQKGLKDGTIDFIASNHMPHDTEGKDLEFPYAKFGAIGLETAYALTNTVLGKKMSVSELVEKWAINARKVLKMPIPSIKEGEKACLTLFNPQKEWIFEEKDIRSKSRNTPLVGQKLKGKVFGIINNGQLKK